MTNGLGILARSYHGRSADCYTKKQKSRMDFARSYLSAVHRGSALFVSSKGMSGLLKQRRPEKAGLPEMRSSFLGTRPAGAAYIILFRIVDDCIQT